MKDFREEIINLFEKLKSRQHFAFSKYADGEYAILTNKSITNCDGWTFDAKKHETERNLLLDSFKYDHEDYYLGISCPCCQPKSHIEWMRNNVGTKNVTYANVFVNSNYSFFIENFIPEFDNWNGRVVLFANEKGKDKNLPFKIDVYIPLNINGWKEPFLSKTIEESKKYCIEQNNQLFLFSAGPLGNILAHQLHMHNNDNTYIDIGSTINPWIVGKNRDYLQNKSNLSKVCVWQ